MFLKRTKLTFLFLLVFGASFLYTTPSYAVVDLKSQIDRNINAGTNVAGLGKSDPRTMVASVIKIFLSLVGITFTALIVLSGYNLLTAAGDEGKVEKAKKTVQACIIGLAITLGAYSLTTFLGKSAVEITTQDAQAPVDDRLDYDRLKNDIQDAINDSGPNVQ
jgi:hypothetical protein